MNNVTIDYMISYVAASNLLSKEDILFRLEYYTNKKDYLLTLNKMFINALGLNNNGKHKEFIKVGE